MDHVVDRVQIDGLLESPPDNRFIIKKKQYTQYNKIYNNRLSLMRPLLKHEAVRKWGSEIGGEKLIFTDKIIEAESNMGQICVLIGTLYKEMALKPSVLDEFKEYSSVHGEVKPYNISSSSDSLLLEDDSGRVTLRGMEPVTSSLVTGIIAALKGSVGADVCAPFHPYCNDILFFEISF